MRHQARPAAHKDSLHEDDAGVLSPAVGHKNSEEGGNGGLDVVGAGKGYNSERVHDKNEAAELHDI